jgi:phosphoserine phosphatase
MDRKSAEEHRYTGLILLSGIDSPGISSALFSTLEPFSITILDIEQVLIRSRLILTVLIELDPAHAAAIEDDLAQCAANLNVDIATSFGTEPSGSIVQKTELVHVIAVGQKITPDAVAKLTTLIAQAGGNIERMQRLASLPLTVFDLLVSGVQSDTLKDSLAILGNTSKVDFYVESFHFDLEKYRSKEK